MIEGVEDRIRKVIAAQARISVGANGLSDTDDLYRAGMSSHASVNLMLALEDEFDIEFPDRMLRRNVFESVAAIRAALTELSAETAAA
ncbi:MAG TPA: acyl carrier protein [Vicinamibacterales bacterium]